MAHPEEDRRASLDFSAARYKIDDPVSIASSNETGTYDADGERIKRTSGGTTTIYVGGLWEETSAGVVKSYYSFNGALVALRESTGVSYLHGDHLGSLSVASNASAQGTPQTFDPWGKRRSGGISQTSLNYTGQRLDDTGLLYYHARYYDPILARFISADSMVPEQANPQDLNRYSYVHNNPVRYNDPSGHCLGWLWNDASCRPIWQTGAPPSYGDALDAVQTGLDVVGMIPGAGEGFDLVNAGISAARGNYADAALSVAAMVPLAGTGAKLAGKYGDEALAIVKQADEVLAACSFSAETPVVTADGAVAIGDIEVGDLVLAWDEATGRTSSYTVTAVLVHLDPTLVQLTIDDERIETTPEHPFSTTVRGWVPAVEVQVGEHVRQADGGAGVVRAIKVVQRPQVMYNLSVATAHTFFVGKQHWLVHNTCPIPSQVWSLDSKPRGTAIENMFGQNTGTNFKAYDVWDPQNKLAISIKSINLNLDTYVGDIGNINRALSKDLKDILKFTSDRCILSIIAGRVNTDDDQIQ